MQPDYSQCEIVQKIAVSASIAAHSKLKRIYKSNEFYGGHSTWRCTTYTDRHGKKGSKKHSKVTRYEVPKTSNIHVKIRQGGDFNMSFRKRK